MNTQIFQMEFKMMHPGERKLLFDALRKITADQYNEHKKVVDVSIHHEDLVKVWYINFIPMFVYGCLDEAFLIIGGESINHMFSVYNGMSMLASAAVANIICNLFLQLPADRCTDILCFKKPVLSKTETDISGLKAHLSSTVPSRKTFSQIVSQSLAAPSTQVSLIRAAELAQDGDSRKCSVIIRNADISTDSSEHNEFGNKLVSECQTSGSCQVFRIPLKNDLPPLIKVQFPTKEDAIKVLKSFESVKGRLNGCRKATIRQDLSKPELSKFRDAWKDAIRRNNQAGKRLFTVRNLEVVKIQYKDGQEPYPWITHQNK